MTDALTLYVDALQTKDMTNVPLFWLDEFGGR